MDITSVAVGGLVVVLVFTVMYLAGRLRTAQLVNDHLLKANNELHETMVKVCEQDVAIINREKQFLALPIHIIISDAHAEQIAQRVIEALPDADGKKPEKKTFGPN